jgi:beta-lactamase regulating signal transducer with metallopeptidase domain
MHEHVARTLYYFEIHLLYASIVWCAAWLLTSILPGSATTKYWIWVVTAFNFILPLGAILDKLLASHLSWASPLGVVGDLGVAISENVPASVTLGVVWLLGAIVMVARLCLRLRADHRNARSTAGAGALNARQSLLAHGVPVRFGENQAPAVDGVLHPHISLPDGIDHLLSERELDAVLIHEVTHARRRDNLIRLIYELGLCGLWFHPLVWITGSRIALYRELSCDESVIQNAHGEELVSALAKLANPEKGLMLQASASSFISHRLARLATHPQPAYRAASILLTGVFGAVLFCGVFGTVAHTACCFVAKGQSPEVQHAATCNRVR